MVEEEKKEGYSKKSIWQWIIIYLIAGTIAYGLFAYFGPGKRVSKLIPSDTITPTKTVVNEITVSLNAQNNSGESGTATLKEEDGKIMVTISLTGFVSDIPQPAHIHAGSCPGVGTVKYPLKNVVNGQSITAVPVTLEVLKQDLPLAINVHKSATDITNYTSCGELVIQ